MTGLHEARWLPGVSVVTTCYNERGTIGGLIKAVRKAMENIPHEVIVVDDSSPDGTYELAAKLADLAIRKKREGQTKGFKCGIEAARYPIIVTLDSDLENDPRHVPELLEALAECDVVVASRRRLPRMTEKLFSLYYGKRLGVRDILSNFRAFRKRVADDIAFGEFESYGAEFLIRAKAKGYRIGEVLVETVRRRRPRLGNAITANLKILRAFISCILLVR